MRRDRQFGKNLGRTIGALALCAPLLVGASGCVALAAGAAAGGAGYAYYLGNVGDTYDGDFATVWKASEEALWDLALPVTTKTADGMAGTIETVNGKGERVKIIVEQQKAKIPTDPPRTEVNIRVATFGDSETSKRLHQQIVSRLASMRGGLPASAAHVPAAPPPANQANWRTATPGATPAQ